MTVHIDPSLPMGPPAPQRPQGDGAQPRAPLVTPATPAPASAPAALPAVPGAAPVDSDSGAAAGSTPAAALPADLAAKTQVSISPQGRQSLGEATAALQRQTILLDALNPALGTPGAAGAASARNPAGVAAGAPTLAGPGAAAAPGTVLPSLASAEVAPATGVAGTPGGTDALARPGAPASALASGPAATASTAAAASSGAARLPWPTGGVSAPLQALLGTLVQQTTAAVLAQRVLAIQPWPAALVAQVDGKGAPGAAVPLQTWLVHQGVVQTPEGARGVSVTLRVPGPWLQALEQTQAAATPGRSWQAWLLPTLPHTPAPSAPALQAAFAGPSRALPSGTFALALESAGGAGARTSALLTLEFQPLLAAAAQAGVYGRDLPHLRQDPWLQMAALQASGQVERDENRARHGSAALCDTAGCPYRAQAACVQPFCAVLQGVPQVAALHGPGAPG